jgi:hypothetical protein
MCAFQDSQLSRIAGFQESLDQPSNAYVQDSPRVSQASSPVSSVICYSAAPSSHFPSTMYPSQYHLQPAAGPPAQSHEIAPGKTELPCHEREGNDSPESPGSNFSRRGPSKKLNGDERCSICTRRANGYHYNVLSCEGCKGFFRRTMLNNFQYVCRNGLNNCDLATGPDRQRCQKCRIDKCLKTGMRERYVRRRKNRTRNMRMLENMKRPTVIVKSFSTEQHLLLNEVLNGWKNTDITPIFVRTITPLFIQSVRQMR